MRHPKMKKKYGSPHWFRIYGGIKFFLILEFFPVFLKKVMFFYGVGDVKVNKTI